MSKQVVSPPHVPGEKRVQYSDVLDRYSLPSHMSVSTTRSPIWTPTGHSVRQSTGGEGAQYRSPTSSVNTYTQFSMMHDEPVSDEPVSESRSPGQTGTLNRVSRAGRRPSRDLGKLAWGTLNRASWADRRRVRTGNRRNHRKLAWCFYRILALLLVTVRRATSNSPPSPHRKQ